MSVHSMSSLISYLVTFFQADFWFDCSETVVKSFSADTEVLLVLLVVCIMSGSEKFLDEALLCMVQTSKSGHKRRRYEDVVRGDYDQCLGFSSVFRHFGFDRAIEV